MPLQPHRRHFNFVLASMFFALLVAFLITHYLNANPPAASLVSEDQGDSRSLSWQTGILLKQDPRSPTGWRADAGATSPYAIPGGRPHTSFKLAPAQGTHSASVPLRFASPAHATTALLHLDDHRPVKQASSLAKLTRLSPGKHTLLLTHPWYAPTPYAFTLPRWFPKAHDLPPLKADYTGNLFELDGVPYRVAGHSGGSPDGGYNSMAACDRSRELGVFWMEIDILLAGDGVPICFHDWDLMKSTHGLESTASSAELAAAGIMTLPACLSRYSHLVLDVTHNSERDLATIVAWLEQTVPKRIRDDVVLLAYRTAPVAAIKALGSDVRFAFNLASWSTTGAYGPSWPAKRADVLATTDFYVVNPSSLVDNDLMRLLTHNRDTTTVLAVMDDHDPGEIKRLARLAAMPLLWDISKAPCSLSP